MDSAQRAETVTTLKKARGLIEARGYQPEWDTDGPLNISNALSRVCEEYEPYLLARQSFSKPDGPINGISSWETYKRRSKSEVLELFDTTIKRVENGKANPHGTSPGPGSEYEQL